MPLVKLSKKRLENGRMQTVPFTERLKRSRRLCGDWGAAAGGDAPPGSGWRLPLRKSLSAAVFILRLGGGCTMFFMVFCPSSCAFGIP